MRVMNLTLCGSYVVTIAALGQNATVPQPSAGDLSGIPAPPNGADATAGGGLSDSVVTMTLEQDVTVDGRVVVKEGSRLIGYLTAAPWRYHAPGPESAPAGSTLAIVLDRVVASDGREVPIGAVGKPHLRME